MISYTGHNFVVEPNAGLGNRLLAFASAYELGKKTKRHVDIMWNLEPHCMARFEDLFLPPDSFDCAVYNLYEWKAKGPIKTMYGNWVRKQIHEAADIFWENGDTRRKYQLNEFYELEEYIKTKKVCIKAASEFQKIDTDSFSFLHPSKEVSRRAETVWNSVDEQFCGIHIRRTDHADAIRYSPTSAFEQEIRLWLKKFPKGKIYLSTDDASEQKHLVQLFGRSIIYYHEEACLKRDSKRGMQDALIDMLALAKCGCILESAGSTFGTIAGLIGGKPIKVIKTE